MSLKTAIVQPGMFKSPPFSLQIPNHPIIEGETIPRRNAKYLDKLLSTPEEGISTLYDVLRRSAAKFGDLNAMGTRKLIEMHTETKTVKQVVEGKEVEVVKKWAYFEMGKYDYETFGQYVARTTQIGSGFRNLGMETGDLRIGSQSLMASAVTQSMPIVTSYATLGEAGLEISILQSHAKAIFVDPDLLGQLIKPLAKTKDLKWIIYNDKHEVKHADIQALNNANPNVKIMSLEELRVLGERNPFETVPPYPEDLCCLMYTSGTTGAPKGVPLKHRNIVASIAGLDSIFSEYVSPSDSVLAYLPLAHIFEFVFENACLFWGVRMGYGSSRTLSNLSMRDCQGDIQEFRPTILVGVPAVWETLRKGIEKKVAAMGWLGSNMFWTALKVKSWFGEKGLIVPANLLDWLVFNTIKQQTGGRLRACFNGAGPLGKETRRFISYALVPLVSGYGLTETCAMGALQDPLEWTDDTLGDIPGSIEIKLVDFPDAGYFSTNEPPQGEILVRGDAVMEGYYENEEETAAAMAPGGWFRTGDIGEWAPNGHLKIIDRKKNLVKTLNGEYIALEKLESIYCSSNIVSNLCVYAAADRNKPIAIVIPILATLQKLAEDKGIKDQSYEKLVQNDKISKLVLRELQDTGRKAGLAPFQILDGVVLTDAEWTPQNGFLTAAQKLSRRKIVAGYETEIDVAYGTKTIH
ncbi:probable long-chain-fatty-acid-CoA ligase [Rhynchosporium agropyri]|uniref:Probable long-chain-fatty-acid-CoA ligase n=1 Tax=Rhynchosporium agropyri TaxID=914238 RepID=A0A1E1KGN3_9HELO|nr:probable long-chain-fatty-acid-CoA ligase [Rhynchosporium agropyri]